MLVASDASALPRGWNTRAQNVKPNCCGSLCGKYHFSANAHRNRLSSGPKMANATRPSNTALAMFDGQREAAACSLSRHLLPTACRRYIHAAAAATSSDMRHSALATA